MYMSRGGQWVFCSLSFSLETRFPTELELGWLASKPLQFSWLCPSQCPSGSQVLTWPHSDFFFTAQDSNSCLPACTTRKLCQEARILGGKSTLSPDLSHCFNP